MKDFLLSATDREPDYRAAVNAVDLTGEDADTFFDALGSETSRAIFDLLYEEPRTPTELAGAIDSSRQNVHYHLQKLEAADLVHVVDTVYSSRGTEVDVYAPTSEAVVLLTGQESTVDRIKEVLSRFVGGLLVLLLAALLLQAAVAGGLDVDFGAGTDAPSAGGAEPQGAPTSLTPTPAPTDPPETAVPRAAGGGGGASSESTPTPEPAGATVSGGTVEVQDAQKYSSTTGGGNQSNDTVIVTNEDLPLTPTRTPTPEPTATPTATPTRTAPRALPSAVFFFAGGLLALALSAAWQFRRD